MSQLVLADSIWMVDLVSKDEEWGFSKVFHGKKSIELSLGFGETFMVLGVDEEDYTRNFWEIILPQSSCCRNDQPLPQSIGSCGNFRTLLMATQVKGSKSVVSDRQFFRCCRYIKLACARSRLHAREDLLGCNVGCKIATRSFYKDLSAMIAFPPKRPWKPVYLQHVQECGFSSIVKTKEE